MTVILNLIVESVSVLDLSVLAALIVITSLRVGIAKSAQLAVTFQELSD